MDRISENMMRIDNDDTEIDSQFLVSFRYENSAVPNYIWQMLANAGKKYRLLVEGQSLLGAVLTK
jgi:hypothetical protein